MLAGRSLAAGLLVLATVSACSTGRPESEPPVAAAVVPSYEAPAGAPDFCAQLASATDVAQLPTTVGRMAAGSRDVETRLDLSGAITELLDILDAVRTTASGPGMEAALGDLLDALRNASIGPLPPAGQEAIRAGLDAVGREAQPLCEFPR